MGELTRGSAKIKAGPWCSCILDTDRASYHNLFSPSQKHFVLISLQVGVRTNPPDWFQLCLTEFNPCNCQKGLIPPSQEKG